MAVNVAVVAAAATETEPGTEMAALELERATEAPEPVAGLVSVIVQVVDPAEATAAAEQESEASWTGAEIVRAAD